MNPVPVVAAIIERDGRFLVGRRPAHKRHGGLWEFPGGKVDAGETVAEAARRELDEELTLSVVEVEDRLHHVDHAGGIFAIHFPRVRVQSEPHPLEHEIIGWFTLDELGQMALAPADAGFVEWLSNGPPSSRSGRRPR